MMLATKDRRRQEEGKHLLFLLFFVAKQKILRNMGFENLMNLFGAVGVQMCK